MSHFIENTQQYLGDPIIKTRGKQVVVPPFKNFKNYHGECDDSEQKMLKKMFFQLKNQEYQKIHKENQYQMRKQFIKLKSKMKHKTEHKQDESYQSSVHKVMVDDTYPKLDLSDIMNMSPMKIDLMKKHRNKIHRRLFIYREAQQIGQNKQKFNEWNDEKNNSPLKSPMFTKMTFLLQKLSRTDKAESAYNSPSRKTFPNKVISRKKNLPFKLYN